VLFRSRPRTKAAVHTISSPVLLSYNSKSHNEVNKRTHTHTHASPTNESKENKPSFRKRREFLTTRSKNNSNIMRQEHLLALLSVTMATTVAFCPPSLKHTRSFTASTIRSVLFEPPEGRQEIFQLDELDDDDDDEEGPVGFYDIDYEDDEDIVLSRDQERILTEREDRLYMGGKIEKCILVGVEDLSKKYKDKFQSAMTPEEWQVYFTLEESMTEMRELIRTAGMNCVGEITQRLQEVNPKTYIGTGKVKECDDLMKENGEDCCTVIFDAELTPGQQKHLENAFNKKLLQNDFLGTESRIKVIDRTALILDIFAQHAKTREGKLQVDLALHEYRKPRLTKMWTHLERQSGAGGVGLRGPGESQLEIDKRLVRDRIITLKKKIDLVQRQRDLHRKGRERTGLPVLALVGYTNAGKSTMLNFLTSAGVIAENILFATLDPTTRKVKLPGYRTHPEVLLTDTVGFIQKLPTQLVAAFRATLEEVREADVLIHIVDVSNPMWEKQQRAVIQVLTDIDAIDRPIVTVFNKIDLLDPDVAEDLKIEAAMGDHQVAVSSLRGDGLQDFVAVVEDALADLLVPIEVEIPYDKGDDMNLIHEVGNVEVLDYRAGGTYVLGRVTKAVAMRLAKYSVKNEVDVLMSQFPDDEIDWVALGRGRHTVTRPNDVLE